MYEQVLEQTGRLNAQVDRQLSPPQVTTSENVEKMVKLDLFVERFIDGSEEKKQMLVFISLGYRKQDPCREWGWKCGRELR